MTEQLSIVNLHEYPENYSRTRALRQLPCRRGHEGILAMWHRVAAPESKKGLGPSNHLLAALPSSDLQSLHHLEVTPLARGSVLCEADEPLTRVYFVETGVVSLLSTFANRSIVGVATTGREGAVGAPLLLSGGTAPGRYRVLVPGSALTIEAPAFRRALQQSPKLRTACQAYARALFAQMLQAVPCNKLHTVEQRCARWLLTCGDQTDDTFELAPEDLAEMLGVPPATTSAMAATLQQAGLIRYRRRTITLLDRSGLEAAACACYRMVRDRCRRLLASSD
jgi:CRP-like cAMP-binding protein